MRYWPILVALCSALVACGNEPDATPRAGSTASPPPNPELGVADYEGIWELRSGQGPTGDIPLVPHYPVTMEITEHGLRGTAACNRYFAEVEISGTSFRTRGGSINQMGCSSEIQQSEQTYLAALASADSIVRDGDSLILTGDQTRLEFDRLEPPPVAQLVGTKWKLETLVFGSGSEPRAMPPVEPAFLYLRRDGSFEGATGCAPITGEWISSAGLIDFVDFRTEPPCPPRLDEQHGLQIGALGDGFRAKVEGNRLTITEAQGTNKLVYRAD